MKMDKINDFEDDLVDITDLLKSCASQCLSYSYPFIPANTEDAQEFSSLMRAPEKDEQLEEVVFYGNSEKCKSESKFIISERHDCESLYLSTAPLNLHEAMSALELGDNRMDCCEIPTYSKSPDEFEKVQLHMKNIESCKNEYETLNQTVPPRIAPKNLSDGTPIDAIFLDAAKLLPRLISEEMLSSSTLLVAESPCPSLMPYWDNLALCSSSPSSFSLLPLLLLQLIALEAYIGANNGGSNAAETLYCMLWCHDGVLMDMAERLNAVVNAESSLPPTDEVSPVAHLESNSDEMQELKTAQWTLFASSLGAVRLAEAVRWAVVNGNIYEEEDFGVAIHNGTMIPSIGDSGKVDITNQDLLQKTNRQDISMSFCPDLKKDNRFVQYTWDTAISKLRDYRTFSNEENTTIDACLTILQLQNALYLAIHTLSNLNDENVTQFSQIARKCSNETVSLLKNLRENPALEVYVKNGLVEIDGRLRKIQISSSSETIKGNLNMFLSASFDPFVNRRLLCNAPIRKAYFHEPLDVIESLSMLSSQLEWAVCDVLLNGNTLGRITRMLENNSLRGCGGAAVISTRSKQNDVLSTHEEFVKPPVGINILCRSLLILNLYFNDKLLGQYDFVNMIGQHMKQICAVPEKFLESSGSWIARLTMPMYDSLKAHCLDRHRERTYIGAVLLPTFGSLQKEAMIVDDMFRTDHELDSTLASSYATNYIILQTLRLMERHVGIGIGLGLYPNWYDLSTTFWYRDFILSAMISIRDSIEKDRIARKLMELQIKIECEEEEKKNIQMQKHSIQKRSNVKKKKGKKVKGIIPHNPLLSDSQELFAHKNKTVTAEDFEDWLECKKFALQRELCRGLVRQIAALRQSNLLKDPLLSMTIFTTHKKRFEKRFEAFHNLPQPPTLMYEDYEKGSDFCAISNKDLISSSLECFQKGKVIINQMLEAVVPSDSMPPLLKTEQRTNNDFYISIHREEILALAKVCVSNSLCLHKLISVMDESKKNESAIASLAFDAHNEYCTIKL